jgi:dehydrogenase/reductase SDR family member 12
MKSADLIDRAIEAPVVTSFTSIGYSLRKRIDRWTPLAHYDLRDRVVVITGPTSGLGEAAAEWFARLGATLVLVARNEAKAKNLAERLKSDSGNEEISAVVADMGDRSAIRAAAGVISNRHSRLDALVHNAGALLNERRIQPDGLETTVAVHVVGPFLMTGLLLDRLGPGSRVVTVSSGGMYTAPLTVEGLEMSDDKYNGSTQYALAKRAQVTLNEMWAEQFPDVRFHAMHPGWADTSGVADSLPRFRRLVGPLLRSSRQGADTMVWLTADDTTPLETSGKFWLDRRVRDIHKFASTRKSDIPERRQRLLRAVSDRAGWAFP